MRGWVPLFVGQRARGDLMVQHVFVGNPCLTNELDQIS